jgi:hypothetical protein
MKTHKQTGGRDKRLEGEGQMVSLHLCVYYFSFSTPEDCILTYNAGAILRYVGKAGLPGRWYRRPIVSTFVIIFIPPSRVPKFFL